MKTRVLMTVISTFFAASASVASSPFKVVCEELLQRRPKISNFDRDFSMDLRRRISQVKIENAFAGIEQETGPCLSFVVELQKNRTYKLTVLTGLELRAFFNVSLDPVSNSISSILFDGIDDPKLVIRSRADLSAALRAWDQKGTISATIATTDRSVIFSENGTTSLAVGSTFKLYVLGALESSIVSGVRTWGESLAIHEEWKSLPSGVMQDLPAGTPVSLFDYAQNMISISDNTATDHLIHLLGRGGSEPGVLSMTYLLESKRGCRGCVSLSWNNRMAPVSQARFFDLVRKTLTFAELEIP